jgi:DNA-binding beta-propeller fold protein YncE
MTVPIESDDIIVADRGPYTGTGTILLVKPDGSQTILTTALKDPYGITMNYDDGNVYVADYETLSAGSAGGIYKLDLYDLSTTLVASGGDFVTPFDLTADSDGYLYVADLDAFGTGAIFKVDPTNGTTTVLTTGNNFFWLRGITGDGMGNLWVTELGPPAKVIHVDTTTGVQTVVASGGFLDEPTGLMVDFFTGDLMVVDSGRQMILGIPPFGGFPQYLIASDPLFIRPTHISMSPCGCDFYVTDGRIGAGVGERRLLVNDFSTTTVKSTDGFFDQPRGVLVVP